MLRVQSETGMVRVSLEVRAIGAKKARIAAGLV
jgi:hypothetical protein